MSVMADRTGDVTEMRLVRITFREVFRSSFGCKLFERAVATQAAAIRDSRIQQRSFFPVATAAANHCLRVQMIGVIRLRP